MITNLELTEEIIKLIDSDKGRLEKCSCEECAKLLRIRDLLSIVKQCKSKLDNEKVPSHVEIFFGELFKDMFSVYKYCMPREVLVHVSELIDKELKNEGTPNNFSVQITKGIRIVFYKVFDADGKYYEFEYAVYKWGRLIGKSCGDLVSLPIILQTYEDLHGYSLKNGVDENE